MSKTPPKGFLEDLDAKGETDLSLEDDSFWNLPFGEQNKIPESLQKEWKEKGLCPKCGSKMYFSHLQLICKYHGEVK